MQSAQLTWLGCHSTSCRPQSLLGHASVDMIHNGRHALLKCCLGPCPAGQSPPCAASLQPAPALYQQSLLQSPVPAQVKPAAMRTVLLIRPVRSLGLARMLQRLCRHVSSPQQGQLAPPPGQRPQREQRAGNEVQQRRLPLRTSCPVSDQHPCAPGSGSECRPLCSLAFLLESCSATQAPDQ